MSMDRLPIVPRPAAGEHVSGYMRRLAERNGFDTPFHINEAYGLDHISPCSAEPMWRRLARATGLAVAELEPMRWPRSDPDDRSVVLLFGRAMRLAALDMVHMRLCPKCIRRDGVLRQDWSLHQMTACAEHGMELTDRCGTCGKHLLLDQRSRLWSCSACDADLRAMQPRAADDGEVAMAGALQGALTACPYDDERLPPAFTGLPADNLATVIGHLGRLAILEADDRPSSTGRRLRGGGAVAAPDVNARRAGVRAAAAMLMDWPASFERLLDRLVDRNPDPVGADPLARRFSTEAGLLAIHVPTGLDGQPITFLAEPLTRHLEERLGHRAGQRLPRRSAKRRKAADDVHVDLPADLISQSRAMEILEGDPTRLSKPWVQAGLLTEHTSGGRGTAYSAAEVTSLRDRMRALPDSEDGAPRLVSLGDTAALPLSQGYQKTHLLRDLFSGALPVRVSGPVGVLGDILADPYEVAVRREVELLSGLIATDAFKRLVTLKPIFETLWGPDNGYAPHEAEQLVALGRLRFRYMRISRSDPYPRKCFSVVDLVREAQRIFLPRHFDVAERPTVGEEESRKAA